MKCIDSLVLEPVFSTQNRCVIGARVIAQGDDAAIVDAALCLTEAFRPQLGFERFYVCLHQQTTDDLSRLRPILQLLQGAPEARTMLCLVYHPGTEQGQLPIALSLLSALDVELCLALGEITPQSLRYLADLPMQSVQLYAGPLYQGACCAAGYVDELFMIAQNRGLTLLAWDVHDYVQLCKLLELGCRNIHGRVIGTPMMLPGFLLT